MTNEKCFAIQTWQKRLSGYTTIELNGIHHDVFMFIIDTHWSFVLIVFSFVSNQDTTYIHHKMPIIMLLKTSNKQ
jgi:hypothetical protein